MALLQIIYTVRDGKWDTFKASPPVFQKCIGEKGNVSMLTVGEGQCFKARACLLLFFLISKESKLVAFDFMWLCRVELSANWVVYF